MNLKCILLKERSQTQKATHCRIPFTQYSGKGKRDVELPRAENRGRVGCQGLWGHF